MVEETSSMYNTAAASQKNLGGHAAPGRSLKRKYRPRASQACEMCRAKKAKCDQGQPCQICKDREIPCVYTQKRAKTVFSTPRVRSPSPVDFPTMPQALNVSTVLSDQPERNHFAATSKMCPDGNPGNRIPPEMRPQQDHEGPELAFTEHNIISAVNQLTSGAEFYGKSSNFVLLNQLLSQARGRVSKNNVTQSSTSWSPNLATTSRRGRSLDQQLPAGLGSLETNPTPMIESRSTSESQTPLSVVNLLCDENAALPSPNPASPMTVAGRAQQLVSSDSSAPEQSSQLRKSPASEFSDCFFGNPMLLEREYVNLYFHNLHCIHPFLPPEAFKVRCEREIWAKSALKRLRRSQMHFLALYNAVLAVGALTAPTDSLHVARAELETRSEEDRQNGPKHIPSSICLSKLYFQRTRRLLGDVFEICSLEGTQALLLLSIYCQHALRPHASYLYSGMAVKTALAIGLTTRSALQDKTDCIAADNLWSCIFSQEIKVACSSGRPSSLTTSSQPQFSYSIYNLNSSWSERENPQSAIFPLQVALASILSTASTQIYTAEKISQEQKAQTALQLDHNLDIWENNLPDFLNFEVISFNEFEWASKQKLTLRIWFYYTKMFIYRPFIFFSADTTIIEKHVSTCLSAARTQISLLYSGFTHHNYLRSWWYNATHALYASIIILSVLLDGANTMSILGVTQADLTKDIQKSLQIIRAMKSMPVAIRYADLLTEILVVATDGTDEENRRRSAENLQRKGIYTYERTNSLIMENNLSKPDEPSSQAQRQEALGIGENRNSLAREGLLASLINTNSFDDFGTGSDDSMFGNMEGWNVAGNIYSDFNSTTGENADTPLWG